MSDVLAEILANKRGEVERARSARPVEALRAADAYAMPRRNFYGAVCAPRPGRLNLIAEIKRASPSAGVIVRDFDPVQIAREYEAAGAQALSVLTDERYFGGSGAFIEQIKAAVGLPVLRKDFLIDEYQVHESRALGADAVLLIAEALPPAELAALLALARELDLCVLLEVHTREAFLGVMQVWRPDERTGVLLGINNRDLKTQTVDLATTEQLARMAEGIMPIVAESGIRTRADVERMRAAGARAVLVGESLLRAPALTPAVHELLGTPPTIDAPHVPCAKP